MQQTFSRSTLHLGRRLLSRTTWPLSLSLALATSPVASGCAAAAGCRSMWAALASPSRFLCGPDPRGRH